MLASAPFLILEPSLKLIVLCSHQGFSVEMDERGEALHRNMPHNQRRPQIPRALNMTPGQLRGSFAKFHKKRNIGFPPDPKACPQVQWSQCQWMTTVPMMNQYVVASTAYAPHRTANFILNTDIDGMRFQAQIPKWRLNRPHKRRSSFQHQPVSSTTATTSNSSNVIDTTTTIDTTPTTANSTAENDKRSLKRSRY